MQSDLCVLLRRAALECGIEIIKQGACGVLHGYHQKTERYVRVPILGVIRATRRRSIRHFQNRARAPTR